jgi:pyruvate/2-oxoglutarate/acetoin dehydrogenase E1 component/TPP-dependent pyruvate/acetoin dehydrogenase alpha subunit
MVSINSANATGTFTRETILNDYRTGWTSRHASILGRKEVLTGKAKFGIFGDGKEVAQLALARAFRPGDVRSGYYRDQTIMFALGISTVEEFFAQLYANPDPEADPFSAGRQMNAHFATRMLDERGEWLPIAERYNTSSDISPTGGQMPRLVGLAYASRVYRDVEGLRELAQFSRNGEEIAFGTIGNASCAEGLFWESINAAGVLQIPMLVSIWDDGYGISVPNELQITKGDLSELLKGFQRERNSRKGFDIYTVRGWDYPALCETYLNSAAIVRKDHVPAIIHVTEVTQPQGHSTSGSHERYKSSERLAWEEEYDCLRKMREWIIAQQIASSEDLSEIERQTREEVREAQKRAWEHYRAPIDKEKKTFLDLAAKVAVEAEEAKEIESDLESLRRQQVTQQRDLQRAATTVILRTRGTSSEARNELLEWRRAHRDAQGAIYRRHLYSESDHSPLEVEVVPPRYDDESRTLNGFEILNACFDAALARDPRISFMGEDVGRLGDVNQACAGLQEKYGELRVADTGIREATIIGQAIGMAMRGLRPVAEMQYLDYVLYGLQVMSDDLATVRWRSAGAQKAPAIIRTRGHRLEGVWHSGSPMSGIVNLVRGIWVCVPRNMTQAAGMYNTLFRGDDPAIVVEVLNGYRQKERLPANVGEFTIPLGVPEVIREGSDLSVVTYGPLCRIASEAAEVLAEVGIEIEIVDVRTLLPFDRPGVVVESLKKTSRVLFLDEDVPGGMTAFMMRMVLDRDGGYEWLDSAPVCLSAAEHRPAYGSDGDYWSKPNREEIVHAVYALMREAKPREYPELW